MVCEFVNMMILEIKYNIAWRTSNIALFPVCSYFPPFQGYYIWRPWVDVCSVGPLQRQESPAVTHLY